MFIYLNIYSEPVNWWHALHYSTEHGNIIMTKNMLHINTAASLLKCKSKFVCGTVPVCSVGLPDDSGCDLSTEEDAQVADCVGGKHADDGEGDGEVLIQRTWVICRQRQERTHMWPLHSVIYKDKSAVHAHKRATGGWNSRSIRVVEYFQNARHRPFWMIKYTV